MRWLRLSLMAQRIQKGSKRKFGLTPGYTPKLLAQPTETASIPIWQKDGTVKYVSDEDFNWIVKNKNITFGLPSTDQQ